jgi:hypothetical protein
MTEEELSQIYSRALAHIPTPGDTVISLVIEIRKLQKVVEQLSRKRGFTPTYITETGEGDLP